MTAKSSDTSHVRKEWIAFAFIALATLAGALGILRWLAPQLLGLPVDLRLVGVSERQPAFFEGVFRPADYLHQEPLVNDPVTVVRGRPGAPESLVGGPHDLLGFRNRAVPKSVDVVVIGDSQTYGNNALLEDNWPSRMAASLPGPNAGVYAMAVGGWGAAQYVEMAVMASAMGPQLVVVAFYTGNDPLDSFKLAYSMDRFSDLRPAADVDLDDMPAVPFPTPADQIWEAVFADGTRTRFTPTLRLAANAPGPVPDAGYAVMAAAGREIMNVLRPMGMRVLFTIIPTKEFVHAGRVARDGLEAPTDYRRLVEVEGRRIAELSAALLAVPGAGYVDVATPLAAAALAGAQLYQEDDNGHPVADGYRLIGETVAAAAAGLMLPRARGLLEIPVTGDHSLYFLSLPEGLWRIAGAEVAVASGWRLEQARRVTFAALAGLPRLGTVERPDPARFGPEAAR